MTGGGRQVVTRVDGLHGGAGIDSVLLAKKAARRRSASHNHRTMATSGVPMAALGVCANCGQDGDGVKLKNCTACLLVQYCSVDCQKVHRKQHKKACKKRAAELKDERLYNQGHERPEGDFCPICTLPVPMPIGKHSSVKVCCMKTVCDGCLVGTLRGIDEMGTDDNCPFCRTPTPDGGAEILALVQARVDRKDPEGIRYLGDEYLRGGQGLRKDALRAVELWTEAAELGSDRACCALGRAYHCGDGVEQDEARGVRYFEKAAMLGNVDARHILGRLECQNGNWDRAVRHFLIAAKMGDKDSLEDIKRLFAEGDATKSQHAEALEGYQDALEEMKSPAREEAKPFFDQFRS